MTHPAATVRSYGAARGDRLAATLGRWLATYRDAKQHRETAAILRALDDHTLRDIGIDRSEIVSVVHDPSRQRHRYFE